MAVPTKRSWKFRFTETAGHVVGGDFVVVAGRVEPSNPIEAYIEWCQKALFTERYRHPIYSRQYGIEIEKLIRAGLPRDIAETELRRQITETLLVDPRTQRVERFRFHWQGDSVWVTFHVIPEGYKAFELELEVVLG